MKVSKELADVLRNASEEVAAWPKWKKSLDPIGDRSERSEDAEPTPSDLIEDTDAA
jgi:hypothetical protein